MVLDLSFGCIIMLVMKPFRVQLGILRVSFLLSAFCNKNIYEIIILSFSRKMEAFVLGPRGNLVLSVRGYMFFPKFLNSTITYLSLK